MRPDDPCELGYAVVDLHERLGHGDWARELKDRYLADPSMGCEEVLLEAAERATPEQAQEVDRLLPTWRGPSREELLAEAARRSGRSDHEG